MGVVQRETLVVGFLPFALWEVRQTMNPTLFEPTLPGDGWLAPKAPLVWCFAVISTFFLRIRRRASKLGTLEKANMKPGPTVCFLRTYFGFLPKHLFWIPSKMDPPLI